jgi:hypothetical protein
MAFYTPARTTLLYFFILGSPARLNSPQLGAAIGAPGCFCRKNVTRCIAMKADSENCRAPKCDTIPTVVRYFRFFFDSKPMFHTPAKPFAPN